ncbi:hypothetical protein [Paraburkholderia sediminicola]|uniref:hypothetical protein n=1 Tax=Paraburkholderia sediminicola TaxID=458836 RepID=UPI0038BAFEB2
MLLNPFTDAVLGRRSCGLAAAETLLVPNLLVMSIGGHAMHLAPFVTPELLLIEQSMNREFLDDMHGAQQVSEPGITKRETVGNARWYARAFSWLKL